LGEQVAVNHQSYLAGLFKDEETVVAGVRNQRWAIEAIGDKLEVATRAVGN
jgi:hypothetical protein